MGYNAPSGVLGLPAETPLEGDAREGARYLADDVNGIRAARGADPPHLTVLGHSYGSVATGMSAAGDGLPADDIVLLGSPGSTVPHASDLKVGEDHVWIGSASQDPVSHLGHFNADPAQASYGGTRFRAENEGFFHANPIYDHVHYFDRQSESLYNMSQVVTGRYDQVQSTPPRLQLGNLAVEPETFRRVGHPTNP
jgi:alpha/beta hydrolase family protein